MSAPDDPGPDRSLTRAFGFSSAGTVGARLMGALGGVLAARLLGPVGRGQFAILFTLAMAGWMGAAAGVQFWVVREVARSGGIRRVRWVVPAHVLVILAVVPLIGFALSPAVRAISHASPSAIVASVALATVGAVNVVLLAIPHGRRAMGVFAAATTASGFVYALGSLVLLLAGEPSVSLVLVVAIAGAMTSCAIAFSHARRTPAGREPEARGLAAYRAALRFGAPAGAGEIVWLVMLRVDVLIVAVLLPLHSVGEYAVALALTELLWVIPDGIALVVMPTVARDPQWSRTPQLLRACLVVMTLVGLVLTVASEPIVRLVFGGEFAHASAAVPFLAVASLAGGAWKILGADVAARGRTSPRLTSVLAGVTAMVAVDVLAVPSMGIAGAALGSACGYLAAALLIAVAWSHGAGTQARVLLRFSRHDVLALAGRAPLRERELVGRGQGFAAASGSWGKTP